MSLISQIRRLQIQAFYFERLAQKWWRYANIVINIKLKQFIQVSKCGYKEIEGGGKWQGKPSNKKIYCDLVENTKCCSVIVYSSL